MASGVANAYAMIDGKKINARYDVDDGLWVIEGNAPAESSWSQPGHVYSITLFAEDEAGNIATLDSTDPTYGNQLRIRVLETTPPDAEIVTPTAMSVIGVNEVEINLRMSDHTSGINLDSVVAKLNETSIASRLEWTEEDGVYTATYLAKNLNDGTNTIEFSVLDNDGNSSVENSVSFIVSTRAPALNILTPVEGVITNGDSVTVSGIVSTFNSAVSIAVLKVNDVPVTVNKETGEFSYLYPLKEGENSIKIVVTDSVGNSTQVVRSVLRDSKAPIISDVSTASVVVNTSGMIKVTFRVTDA